MLDNWLMIQIQIIEIEHYHRQIHKVLNRISYRLQNRIAKNKGIYWHELIKYKGQCQYIHNSTKPTKYCFIGKGELNAIRNLIHLVLYSLSSN